MEAEYASFEKMLGTTAFDGSITPDEDSDGEELTTTNMFTNKTDAGGVKKQRSRSSSASSSGSSRSSSSSDSSASSGSDSPPVAVVKTKSSSKHKKSKSHEDKAESEHRKHDVPVKAIVLNSRSKSPEAGKDGHKRRKSRSHSRSRRTGSREKKHRRRRSSSRGRRLPSPHRRRRPSRERSQKDPARRKGRKEEGHSRRRRHSRERHGKRSHRSRSRERHGRRPHGPNHRNRPSEDQNNHKARGDRGPLNRKQNEPLTFKEKLKQSLMEVQKKAATGSLTNEDIYGKGVSHEKPSNLPLNDVNSLLQAGGKVTPQMALMQTMAAMHQKAQELTGVVVPSYYNPAAINPLKYAEQIQKRKMLWGKIDKPKEIGCDTKAASASSTSESATKDPTPSGTPWVGATFKDDATSERFRKLMGIKGEVPGEKTEAGDETNAKQQELFSNLDQQYEMARMTTHTHRGVGFGALSHVYVPK